MTDSNQYKENNYFLAEIHADAVMLGSLKGDDKFLFEALNDIFDFNLSKIKLRYSDNVGPVNSLRKEIAEELLKSNPITPEFIDKRIREIEEESGKRSFNSYNYFSILFPFFQADFEINVKEALTELSSAIQEILSLGDTSKIHTVDFWGSRGFGDDLAWTAIYNSTHLNHQTAKQLFIGINNGGLWCGLYDRQNQEFIEETPIEINENSVSSIVDFFQPYVNQIKQDEYSTASFLPIGVKGAKFYKLSHGTEFFSQDEIQACIDAKIAVVHEDTRAKAKTPITQYKTFEKAKKGDFFYICWGNKQFLLIGQFIDDEVHGYSLSVKPDGWKERKYRIIQQVQLEESYRGAKKWWAPNDPSTFIEVPESDYNLINQIILRPYFQAEIIADKTTQLPADRVGAASQHKIKVLDHMVSPKLDVKMVANEFANVIDNLKDNKGQMLGVFGGWGRGKTFFVNCLKDEIKPEKEREEQYINLTFNAWKYQESNAIWAYLYAIIFNAHLLEGMNGKSNLRKKLVERWRTVSLNFRRKGYVKFLRVFVSLAVSITITYCVSSRLKLDFANYLVAALGIIGLIQALIIYKRHYQGIQDVLKDYSAKNDYRAILGFQAEIHEELITLVKHWLDKRENERILLFVDDLDRCNEDKIIHIIDALRVMLDDDYLVKKLIIIVAVDELLLERAIQLKYQEFKINNKDKNLVQEYMDKLFIAAIKFPSLYEFEQAVILENYASSILETSAQPVSEVKQSASVEASNKVQNDFVFPDPDLVSSKVVESEFFLMRSELELLQKYSNIISKKVTPRGLRIYMYRYLLSKNLASSYMTRNTRYQLDDKVCDLLAKAIATKSSNPDFSVTEMEEMQSVESDRLREFIPKLIEMVVPY